ncbi:HEXXH motif domain-containing protein [Saccharothrix sp. BKS2]|uniref:HEXXH motif domain-containing protein n=1 Tax=Saccharothrix sp. BKS2 TaxID=3064400 RepID=UPI0039ED1F1F
MAGRNPEHVTPSPTNHAITLAQLDAVASTGTDDGTASLLRDVERTRRLLALRLVLRHAREHPAAEGPLPPVAEAWELLVTAERARPHAVADLLSRPQVGMWSAHVLRRLRGRVPDTTPLWFHVGQLHSLAVAAGATAELRFAMTVPLWEGTAVLPGLGSARLSPSSGWGHGTVMSDASGLTAKRDDGSVHAVELIPIRVFPDGGGAATPRIHLDDTGPYRGLAVPEPPDALSGPSLERWREVLAEAWALLGRDHPHRARELSAGLSVITPRPAAYRFRPHSGSVGDGYGAAIISEPHDAVQLAVTMVHEYQHSKLNAIGHLVPLTGVDPATTCYAPWRDDPRPVSGLYQGVHAFLAVAEFWARQREQASGADAALAHFEFALVRAQVTGALDDLRRRPSLTDLARRFADRLAERLWALRDADVPAGLLAAAETAILDHRAAWRATHLHPVRDHVLGCVERWSAGAPAPASAPPSPVVPDRAPPRLDAKAILTRVLISGRAAFDAMRADPTGDVRKVGTDVTDADFALVTGDHGGARAAYEVELSAGPGRPGAWSGYGLALRALSPGPAPRVLLEQPHVVRAVRAELAARGEAPDVARLAAWLGNGDDPVA